MNGFLKQQRVIKGLLWFFLFTTFPVHAVNTQQIHLKPLEMQGNNVNVQWWLEGNKGVTVEKSEILIDGSNIAVSTNIEPNRGQPVCYMLMLDSSESMKPFFKNNTLVNLLKTIIEEKPDHHYLGFALFAKEWRSLQSPTQDKAALLSGLNKIKMKGKRTELLRFTKEDGMASLDNCPSQVYRKVLVILSDGDAEDNKAYSVESVVKTARSKNVSIYAFGFGDTLALGFIRQLSNDSGGWLSEPKEHAGKKANKAAGALFADSNSGGNLSFTLEEGKPEKSAQIRIMLSSGKIVSANIPLDIKPNMPLPEWKVVVLDNLPLSIKQLDYVLYGLGLLFLALVIYVLYRLLHRDPEITETPRDIEGYLMHQGQSFPVYAGINRLGFLPDNDIVIDNDTVGRTHATLHHQGEGDVILTDLNSLNGSWVNGNRIERPVSIQDGDTISLGNWQAIFQRAQEDEN